MAATRWTHRPQAEPAMAGAALTRFSLKGLIRHAPMVFRTPFSGYANSSESIFLFRTLSQR